MNACDGALGARWTTVLYASAVSCKICGMSDSRVSEQKVAILLDGARATGDATEGCSFTSRMVPDMGCVAVQAAEARLIGPAGRATCAS